MRRNKIENPARQQLIEKIEKALEFADHCCRLVEAQPDKSTKSHADELRNSVRENAEAALEEIGALATPMACEARKLVRDYKSIFENEVIDSPRPNLSLSDLLRGDLLADPDVPFDETDSVVDNDILQGLVDRDKPDFGEAAIKRAERKDFVGAWKTLEFAEQSGQIDEGGRAYACTEIKKRQEDSRQELKRRFGDMSDLLDTAHAREILSEEVFEELRESLPDDKSLRDDYSDLDKFGVYYKELDRIGDAVYVAGKPERDRLQSELDELNPSPEKRSRIESAIEKNQFSLAHDYIDRIRSGGKLSGQRSYTKHTFDRFFPEFVEEYVEYQNAAPDALAQVQQALKDRASAGPVNAVELSPDAAEGGLRLLEIWSGLKINRAVSAVRDLVRELMNEVGFTVKLVRKPKRPAGRITTFVLETESVEKGNISRLPEFGSRARGWYRLIVIREHETEEVILRQAEKKDELDPPTNIVIFLNALDAEARRASARDFNSGKECGPTIVLDEVLVVFLAAQPGDRFRTFFDCAAAFSSAQPFDPRGAEVPPEMFFGRSVELKKILSMSGADEMTHLVYGGRRMGKTALLKRIAREYLGNQDQLMLLIDLSSTSIGADKPTDDLWGQFVKQLAEPLKIDPSTRDHQLIGDGIKQWLGEKKERRILLMVDEADAFFQADGRDDYRVLRQVKSVMETNDQRFKVVFAGLHNVQRIARDSNTPFAHLGDSLRIGPMLPETDSKAIEDLILGPMETLGYRFESIDSVVRIATEANYYPALAQQFCMELLRHLRENGGKGGSLGPPYSISAEAVDRICNSPETRKRIQETFKLTIELDSRYEFLTYLIARKSFDNGNSRLRGLSIPEIHQDALKECPAGFVDSNLALEILLEEMEGLGILRERTNKEKGGDKEYSIRTRNLRPLLGNDHEIERRFADAKKKLPGSTRSTFDPALSRRTLNDGTPSSLMADQEGNLLSRQRQKAVALVFGTRLSGIDQVRESLDCARNRWDVDDIRLHVLHENYLEARRTAMRRELSGVDVFLLDMRGAWDPDRIDEAVAFADRDVVLTRTIRTVFLCGPGEAWAWVNRNLPDSKPDALQDFWLGPYAKDFAINLLKKQEAPAYYHDDLENRDPLWPVVVGKATEQKEKGPKLIKDAIDLAFEGSDMVSDILVAPQVKAALRVLSALPGDPMTADDLADLSRDEEQEIDPDDALRVLDWGNRLGILHSVKREGLQKYRLDATYAEGLKMVFEG